MTILYIPYWELHDGLTQSTVFPHLEILLASDKVEKIVFVTIERGKAKPQPSPILDHPKIIYRPLHATVFPGNVADKVKNHQAFQKQLRIWLKEFNVDKVIARATSAGTLVHSLCKETGIPLYVESFEPHADYMIDSNTWKPWDIRAYFQRRWEKKLQKVATGLIPVAYNYKNLLVSQGIPADKIQVVPCSVDLTTFKFDGAKRAAIRQELGIDEGTLTGIYVGKFGGTYYDEESFVLFERLFKAHPTLRVIILSPDPVDAIQKKLRKHRLPVDRFAVRLVPHKEVPAYLSAADFAFSFHKPTRASLYFSPIKNGEYWACGLPIIISDRIGDDHTQVREYGIGEVLPADWMQQPQAFFDAMMERLRQPANKESIREVAKKHRSVEECIKAYKHFQII